MNTSWFSKDLGGGVAAYGPTKQIQEAFLPLFAAAGQSIEMAVFSRHDVESDAVTVYFSPAAQALAKAFGATPCAKPSSKGMGLIVGDQRAWQVFFPERSSSH